MEDPSQVGPYRIVGRLGAGGMGVVFAGLDARGERVAVKVVHASYAADQEFRARFAREIAVLHRVKGTCTARIIDADARAERPWLAAEYVPGPTLDAKGALRGDEWFGLVAGLAEALAAIHGAGVVHRDIKPSNVILSPDGPRLVDFGIARALDGTALTRSGMVVGSPGWVSPEEYGDAPAGPAADVYGWGLLAVYAATGRPPYGTGRPEVLAMKVMHESVDVTEVPDALRGLVGRALAKDPAARPGTAEVVAAVAQAWRGQHGDQLGQGVTAVDDITARLDRTWVLPADDAAWPLPVPQGADGAAWPVPVPRPGARRTAWVVAAAAVAVTVGAVAAVRGLTETTQPNAQPETITTIISQPSTVLPTPSQTQSPSPSQTPTRTPTLTPTQEPPPGTGSELVAALDLALEDTPAATFTFDGGFTQSSAGARATGKLVSGAGPDDLDMRLETAEGHKARYVVQAGATVRAVPPNAESDNLVALEPTDANWYALMVAATGGPSTIREVVANAKRTKRKGRTYTGTLAVDRTNGLLRALLDSWMGGDVVKASPGSYLTFTLAIDAKDRPKKFHLAWNVPFSGAGIYRSDFTTVYRGWTAKP